MKTNFNDERSVSALGYEGDEKVKETLCFSKSDEGVIITPDITLVQGIKIEIAEWYASFNCGLAFLSGFNITREAMNDAVVWKVHQRTNAY
jgi:tagaturonate reductase